MQDDKLASRCQRCRRRQIKCDYQHPACKRCQSDGYECPGYGKRFGIVVYKPNMKRAYKKHGDLTVRHTRSPQAQTRPSGDLTLLCLLDTITFYNTHVAHRVRPDIWPLKRVEIGDGIPWPHLPLFFQRLCIVSFQAWNYHFHHSQPTPQAPFFQHRGRCLSELQTLLQDPDVDRPRIALTSALMLLESDLQLESPDWQIHYIAVTKLIASSGGVRACLARFLDNRVSFVRYMLLDLFSSTILPPSALQSPSSARHAEYAVLLPDLSSEVVAQHIPCAASVLSAIALITSLRCTWNAHSPNPSSVSQRNTVLAELESFDPAYWVTTISAPSPSSTNSHDHLDSVSALQALTKAYRSAAVLYLQHALPLNTPSTSESPLFARAGQECEYYARNLLDAASSPEATQLGRHLWVYLTWPLFVVAYVEVVYSSTQHGRALHRRALDLFGRFERMYQGTSVGEAVEALRGLESRGVKGEGGRWGSHFDAALRFAF